MTQHSHSTSISPEPRTAKAADHPCQLYAHTTSPVPSRTQYHHRHPVYLQNRVYGEIRDASEPDMLWLCGLCHDSIHDWLGYLLGETREPFPKPSPRARAEAERTYRWYKNLMHQLKEKSAWPSSSTTAHSTTSLVWWKPTTSI